MITSLFVFTLAASVQPGSATPAPPPRPHRERRICRTDERLGTIIPRRVCHTAADWSAIDAAQDKSTGRDIDQMRNHRPTTMVDPTNPS